MKYRVLIDIDHYADELNGFFDKAEALGEIRGLYETWIDEFDHENHGNLVDEWDEMIEECHSWGVPSDKLYDGSWVSDDELWLSDEEMKEIGFVTYDELSDEQKSKHGFKLVEEKGKTIEETGEASDAKPK